MTLAEVLARVPSPTNQLRVLLTLFHAREIEGVDKLTASDIRDRLVDARVPRARRMNVSDALSRLGPEVERVHTGTRYEWYLTTTGDEVAQGLVGDIAEDRSGRQEDVAVLWDVLERLEDEVVRGFVEEGIVCLRANALRAATVFIWAGSIRHLEEKAATDYGWGDITKAIQKHDPRVRDIKQVSDFANVNDQSKLIGFRELGMIDKGEWQTLGEGLGLRNRCSHPTKYRPRKNRVMSFIEDVVGIVFRDV